jgi:VCBS repeat-containing protein
MTTLASGDVALIGYSSDTAGKSFAFVLLKDVDATTTVNFTDNGWLAAGGFRAGEGVLSWSAPAGGATAGTVITFTGLTGSFNPSTSGDQIIAYQGPATAATPLFAVDFADNNTAFAADATSSNTSAVPTGLVVGTTALGFGPDNGAYAGPTAGTAGDLLQAIDNPANWTTDDANPVAYKTAFTVAVGTSVSVGAVSVAEGDSGDHVATFTVTRNDAGGAFTVDFATHDGTATAGSDYEAAQGTLTFAAGGPASQTVSVVIHGDTQVEGNETFTLALTNLQNTQGVAAIANGAGTGTILNDDVHVVKTYEIQGAAHTSPLLGQHVVTEGVVTAVDTTGSRGFWIQDQTGDGNDATSDAVFAFTNAAPAVHAGDLVRVDGTVNEFQGSDTNNLTITEVGSSNANVTVEGTGFTVAPTIIGDGGRHIPTEVIDNDHFTTFDPGQDAVDFYESIEGMLVTVKNAQAVDATALGQTWVVADNGDSATGMNDRGGITIAPNDMNPERIEIFTDSGVSNVQLNNVAGDHLGDVTGVVSYFGGNYELLPLSVGSTASAGSAPRETTTLASDASHLTIGAYNLENLDPTDPASKFVQLGQDIAHNLGAPDIIGVEEIQDADGAGPGTDLSGAVTLNKLIDAIVAAGGPRYSFIEIDPTANNQTGGEPNGNIRQAFLYDPTRVSYVDGSAHQLADTDLTNGDAYNNSRKPLVADFTFHGETITAIDVHNYSRGGSDELFGQDQPAINNGDQRRVDQTTPVKQYVEQLVQADPHAHVAVMGDFNAYQFETSLTQLESGGALSNLTNLLAPADRYSYAFEGNMEQIDQMLVSPSLQSGAQFDIVHLNTGVADRPTDHDPIVSRLFVNTAPVSVADNGYAATEDTPFIVDAAHGVLANDTDLNSDLLSALLGQGPAHGALQLNADGSFTYTPGADFNGQDSFTYLAQDPSGASSALATVVLQVAAVNDAPVAHADAASVSENQSVTVDVLGNDTDVDSGDSKSILSVSDTALGGHVTIADGQLVYVADADAFDLLTTGQSVTDSFTYTMQDAAGATSSATVSVAVSGVPDAPTLNGGNGDAVLTGTAGDEAINGGNGADRLFGLAGADALDGGKGDDTLSGGSGIDSLSGGSGDDRLDGGAGDDQLIGGSGADRFVFSGGFGHDVVTDFSHGDILQVDHALFANFNDLLSHAHQVGADVVITYDAADTVTLTAVQLTSRHASDFAFI